MALSVFSFEECNPPSDFIQLAYNVSSPNSLDTSTVFNTYSTNGTSLSLGSSLTQPTECGSGMDIVFMVDYTGSMSGAISNVKTGITNILSTIATESLDNFRVGLCIFDEYKGSVTSPSLYGTNINYTSLPASQKVTINGIGHTQFITCMHPMGGVGDTSVFQTQLNKLAAALPLGNGDDAPEPGGLGVYEVIQNGIAGGFREDAIKVIILITDDVPGGNDDFADPTDTTYFANTLIPLADSLNIQTLVQSTKAYNTTYNNYYALATGTTPIGRYDQVSFATSGWINTGLIAGIQSLCGSSYTATCDCAPSGWYHEDGSSYAFYFDATTCEITNQYNFPPSYGFGSPPPDVGESGETVVFQVETTYVPAGTKLYYTLDSGSGKVSANDFVGGVNSGMLSIDANGRGSFQFTTLQDNITEGPESIFAKLRTGSISGTIVATADRVIIYDTSLTPTATPNPPTPTPTVYQLYSEVPFGNGGKSTDPCGDTTYGIWTQDTSVTIGLQIGDSLYSNASLTPFVGNNLWYGIGDYFGGAATRKVRISDTGIISNIASCYIAPTATPTPTATPIPPTPIPPTATPVPAPTAIPTGTCENVWVNHTEVDSVRYGLQWRTPDGSYRTVRFSNMLGTADYWYSGVSGTAYSVCSTVSPNVYDFDNNALVMMDRGFYVLAQGGTCEGVYCVPPSQTPTSTPVPAPTSTPVPAPTATPYVYLPPTATPFPDPTPFPTAIPATVYKYLMDPCDGTSEYVVAESQTGAKSIGSVWNLTGSTWSSQSYTIIATSSSFRETYISDAGTCGGGGIDPKCLLEGTMVKLANGTQVAIETLEVGQELYSMIVGNMPDSDDSTVLSNWSQSNPTVSNTTATIVSVEPSTVTSVWNFNNDLLISSEHHLHIIKRSGNWIIKKANEILIGDILMSETGSEIVITSMVEMTGTYTVYKLDIETNDIFVANGIITHNAKIAPQP